MADGGEGETGRDQLKVGWMSVGIPCEWWGFNCRLRPSRVGSMNHSRVGRSAESSTPMAESGNNLGTSLDARSLLRLRPYLHAPGILTVILLFISVKL